MSSWDLPANSSRIAVHVGRSFGPLGQPEGWGNPCRSHGPDAGAHEEAVRETRERLWSPAGKWLHLGFYHLISRCCDCHCAAHLSCHVDALLDAFLRLAPRRAAFMRLLKLDGLSLASWFNYPLARRLAPGHRVCLHMGNGSTTAPSGRRSEACCLFRSLLPRHAIP